jgi:hypothetical protein
VQRSGLYSVLVAIFFAVLLLNSCSLFKRETDPLKIEQQLAQAREGERELVQSVIADQERAERFVALIAERDRLAREQARAVRQQSERIAELSTSYHLTRDDFNRAFQTYNDARASNQSDYLAVVAAMKGETTAEEWRAISKYQLKKLNPRQLAYKDIEGLFE